MQKIRKISDFGENAQKSQFLTLIPLDPQIKILSEFRHAIFFTLLTPNFMQFFRKN